MYRPQFAMPQAPQGFVYQPCIYQFDQHNIPALGNLSLLPGQETGRIPLRLDHDAPFILLAVQILNGHVNLRLTDPFGNELMDEFLPPVLYASDAPFHTVLEGPGIQVPKGAVFQVRLQGQ